MEPELDWSDVTIELNGIEVQSIRGLEYISPSRHNIEHWVNGLFNAIDIYYDLFAEIKR